MAFEFKMSLTDIVKSVAIVAVVVFLWYHGENMIKAFGNKDTTTLTETQIVQLLENIAQAQVVPDNDKVNELIAQLKKQNSELIKIVKDQGKKVDELGIVIGELKGAAVEAASSKHEDPEVDTRTYDYAQLFREDTEGKKFPIGDVRYHPYLEDDPWTLNTYPITFHVNVVETEQENGVYDRFVEGYVRSEYVEKYKGTNFPVDVDISWAKKEIKEKSFDWWNPRLGLGGTLTNDAFAAVLDFSIFSYGRTERDMDWRFVTVGGGAYKEGDTWEGVLSVEPFSWNFGNALPLVENVFIGPIWTIDTTNEQGYGLKVAIPF